MTFFCLPATAMMRDSTQINKSFKAATKSTSHQALKQRPKIMSIRHLFIEWDAPFPDAGP
jgi:hypothetical protein